MKMQGWILDLYPSRNGMTLWLIDQNQKHYQLTDPFTPTFYASGAEEKIAKLRCALEQQKERCSRPAHRTN